MAYQSASRCDRYLNSADDDQIHWFSIVNSLLIVLFLTGMVAMIMARTLNQDIAKYERLDGDEYAEETGWKLVHGKQNVCLPYKRWNALV